MDPSAIVSDAASLAATQDIKTRFKDSEIDEILQWLSPINHETRHRHIRLKRIKDTGDWFLRTDEFKNWRDHRQGDEVVKNNILGVYGIPGAGKSVLCSMVIDHMISAFATQEDVCITWLYCDYRNANQTPANMVGSLLRQAVVRLSMSSTLSHEVIHSLLEKGREKKPLDLNQTLKYLTQVLKQFSRSYFCINALEECTDEDRRVLLQSLKGLTDDLSSTGCYIRIFFTARDHVDENVNRYLVADSGAPFNPIHLEANPSDIEKYVLHEIEVDSQRKIGDVPMDIDFKEELVSKIVASSKGMFLLPALQIHAVLEHTKFKDRQEALKMMPEELNGAFKATIDRIHRRETSERAMKILQWVFFAKRPLTVEELQHALSIQPTDID
ncbi:hypothetical protein BZA77DRAFT_271005, partial [Pyronema omphalodes]